MFYLNGIAKLLLDGIHASLRGVCPDTQDIREICNLDRAHLIIPFVSVISLNIDPCRVIGLPSSAFHPNLITQLS